MALRSLARCVSFSVLAAALLAASAAARAEDPPPVPAASAAILHADDVALRTEDVPKGWTLLADHDASAPRPGAEKDVVDAVADALASAPHPSTATRLRMRSLTRPDGVGVTLAFVELVGEPASAASAIQGAAARRGWACRGLPEPSLLVVVAASRDQRDPWLSIASRVAAKRIGALALRAGGSSERQAVLAGASLALEASNGPARLALGRAARPWADGAGAAAWVPVIRELRAAVAPDLAIPLDARQRFEAEDTLGLALLESRGGDEVNREARDALRRAWEASQGLDPVPGAAVLTRYNLACASGRLREWDAAYEHLSGVLEALSKIPDSPMAEMGRAWRTDPDFGGLKADPRWKQLDEAYPAPPRRKTGD